MSRCHRPIRRRTRAARGQSLVEFAMGVPLFLILLLGMVEFGFVVHATTSALEYASARAPALGSALASGTAAVPCRRAPTSTATIIAALQRVVTSPGSQINVGNISQIQIYSANASGDPIGSLINTWVPGTGPTVDGVALQFHEHEQSAGRPARSATGTTARSPDSIGVELTYVRLRDPAGELRRPRSAPAT